MKLLRVAAAALNQTPLDWDGNAANILTAIRDARSRGVSVLCLPELGITGYGCEDAFFSSAVPFRSRRIWSPGSSCAMFIVIGRIRGTAG